MSNAQPDNSQMKTMYVALFYEGKFNPAGFIFHHKVTGESGFQYLKDYNGPPIDPVNLNYQKTGKRRFDVDTRYNTELLHRVFQDALPGAWGMNVLMAEYPDLKKMKNFDRLYWFGDRTVGGISCRVGNSKGENPIQGIEKLMKVRKESIEFFNKAISKIMEKNSKWGLCSHGGARPKSSYVDAKNKHWIVKFNVDLDGFNGARVESSIARMAKKCGISSVDTQVVSLPDKNDVLFIKRYDRNMDETGVERKVHQLSIFAMLNEAKIRGPNEADYEDIVKVVREVSVKPEDDLRQLYKQMIFNISIHNADDHVRNFSMVLTDEGYRLSPAYDMTPIPQDYPHTTSVFGNGRPDLTDESIQIYAKGFGIPLDEAMEMRQQVVDVVVNWRQHMKDDGVEDKDIKYLDRAFKNGIDRDLAIQVSNEVDGKTIGLSDLGRLSLN